MNLKIWLLGIRIKTLPLTLACIFVGNALAFWVGKFDILVGVFSVLTTALFQILANFANDYGDFVKGTDDELRIGPKRISAMSSKRALKLNLWALGALSFASSLLLLYYSNLSLNEFLAFVFLAICSILAALFYTMGKFAYGYYGLGDVFVYIFFGLVAVLGSFYLHSHELFWAILLPASATGFLSMAVLNINNMRDIKNDTLKNKNTIVVKFGMKFAKNYHFLLIFGALLFYAIFYLLYTRVIFVLLIILLCSPAIIHIKKIYNIKKDIEFFPLLGEMSKFALFINLIFCFGLILDKLLKIY